MWRRKKTASCYEKRELALALSEAIKQEADYAREFSEQWLEHGGLGSAYPRPYGIDLLITEGRDYLIKEDMISSGDGILAGEFNSLKYAEELAKLIEHANFLESGGY